MSYSTRWLPGSNVAHWVIWLSTIAAMLYSRQTASIMMIVMMFLICEDYKKRASDFRSRVHLYMLVLSGALLAGAWQRPIAIISVYMVLSWMHLQFHKKAMTNPEYAWFCEHLLSPSALRVHCLAIFVAVCSYNSHLLADLLAGGAHYAASAAAFGILSWFALSLSAIPAALGLSVLWKEFLLLPARAENRFARVCRTLWSDLTFYTFAFAHMLIIFSAIWIPGAAGDQVVNWLAASSRDANLDWLPVADFDRYLGLATGLVPSNVDLAFCLKFAASAIFAVVFTPMIVSSSAFCTSFARRVRWSVGAQSWFETFTEVLRQPSQNLNIRLANPWISHSVNTLVWLIFCYALLFCLVLFTPGLLGESILQSLDQSFADAGFSAWSVYDFPELRVFGASLVAMIGMVPLAVMNCSFFPTFKSKVIALNQDGMLFPRGPYLPLGFRPMRSWSDVRSVKLWQYVGETRFDRRTLIISFFSGGTVKLKLNQLAETDLYGLLSAIDEFADHCSLAPEVLELRASLREELGARCIPHDGQLRNLNAQGFRSTVFTPYEPDQTIPGTEMRVVRQLSAKPLAAVYLVRRADGKLAVVKQFCFPNGVAAGADASKFASVERLRKSFHRECELLRRLDNERIAKVLEVVELENSSLLVIEFARGRDLRDIVERDGVQSEPAALEIARQLVDVMTYLHAQSPPILHRDLTPDNLVIDDDRNLRLIDFGAAHQFLEGITGTLIGKQCYVAPEQLRGEPSMRSDIYSFGCTLYFLLTGDDPIALMQCDPGEQSPVSGDMRKLILDCTSFDELARPASFEDIKDRLDSIADRLAHFGFHEDDGGRIKLPAEDVLIGVASTGESSSVLKTGENVC